MKESTESASRPVIVPQGAIFPDVEPVTNSAQVTLYICMYYTQIADITGTTRQLTIAAAAIEKLNAGTVARYVRLPRVCTNEVLQHTSGFTSALRSPTSGVHWLQSRKLHNTKLLERQVGV